MTQAFLKAKQMVFETQHSAVHACSSQHEQQAACQLQQGTGQQDLGLSLIRLPGLGLLPC